MKGLLIKDLRLLLRQKMTIVIIVLLGVFMSLNGGNVGFSLSYMMVVSASLVYATISYDYFEKGMSFLFTLPVSKKSYVLEKYLLTVLVELCVAAFVVLIEVGNVLLGNPADWMTLLVAGVSCFVAAMILIALYIPVYIKFGPEKSRIAIFILFGSVAVITFLAAKVKPVQDALMALVDALSKLSAAQITAIGVAVFTAIMAASIIISIKVIEKKEF